MVKARVESAGAAVRWDLVNCRRRAMFLLNMKMGRGERRGMSGDTSNYLCYVSFHAITWSTISCRQLDQGKLLQLEEAVRKDPAARGSQLS
jgi:hypothetical protein